MALRTKYRTLAIKAEATAGTPESLASADGAENFSKVSYDATLEAFVRETQGTFSPITAVPGKRSASAKFSTELYNSGSSTHPFWAATLLPMAGWARNGTTGTYKPSIAASTTATIGHYVDGALWSLAGAMLDFTITGESVGKPLMIDWEAKGFVVVPTTTSILTPTYPTVTPPGWKGATLTLGSISPLVVSKMSFKLGNTITLREDATSASGFAPAIITYREPRFSLTVEVPTPSSYEYYAAQIAASTAAFSMALGSGSNGIVTLAAPKLQLLSAPKLTDLDGVMGYELEYIPVRNTAGGDDEVSLTLS